MNPCATVMADAGVARLLMVELLEADPGELTPVPLAPDVDWLHLKFGFATYESRGNNLYTLGWFPAPSTQHCIRYLNAAACQYMMYQYGDWPAGLESTAVAVTVEIPTPHTGRDIVKPRFRLGIRVKIPAPRMGSNSPWVVPGPQFPS